MLRKVIRFPVMMVNFVFINRSTPVLSSYGKVSWKVHGKLYLPSVMEKPSRKASRNFILNYGVQHRHVCDSFYLLVDSRPCTVINVPSTMHRHPHRHHDSMCNDGAFLRCVTVCYGGPLRCCVTTVRYAGYAYRWYVTVRYKLKLNR